MTFNLLSAGNPAAAAQVMQNLRHVNFNNPLLPVDSDGAGVNNTIDLGSGSYGFKDGYFVGTVTVGTVTDGTASITGGVGSGFTDFTVDQLNLNGNTISSTSGDINLAPVAGNDVVIDGHFNFDGADITALTNANTTVNAYAGRNITIESVTFDGGVVDGISNLTMTGTLDLGTNTISDGTFTGTWAFDTSTLYIDATNNRVGIKDTSPSYELDVAGTVNCNNLIAGNTYLGQTVINDSGASTDFRVESNTSTHMIYMDGSADRVGINDSSPSDTLSVGGGVSATGSIQTGSTIFSTGNYVGSQVYLILGAQTSKQTPGAGYISLYFNSTDDKVYAVNSSGTQIELGDFSP